MKWIHRIAFGFSALGGLAAWGMTGLWWSGLVVGLGAFAYLTDERVAAFSRHLDRDAEIRAGYAGKKR